MEVLIVPSRFMSKFGRMDVGFAVIALKYEPLIDELLARFKLEELQALARKLPYDTDAAKRVFYRGAVSRGVWSDFEAALKRPQYRRPSDFAVYCASAAQFGVSKILTQVEDLQKQVLAMVRLSQDLLKFSVDRQCDKLHDALKRGGLEKIDELKEMKDDESGNRERGAAAGDRRGEGPLAEGAGQAQEGPREGAESAQEGPGPAPDQAREGSGGQSQEAGGGEGGASA